MKDRAAFFFLGMVVSALALTLAKDGRGLRTEREQELVDAMGPSLWSDVLDALEARPLAPRPRPAGQSTTLIVGPDGVAYPAAELVGPAGGDWTPK